MLWRVASTRRPRKFGFRGVSRQSSAPEASPGRKIREIKSLAVRSADLLADQITTLAAAKELLIG
jgi:hypothetical protein